MRWASKRQTTRQEDMAYSLLGLFDINMPLLYGEGAGAFRRLQEEIMKKHPADQSILVWVEESRSSQKLLAQSPSAFDFEDKLALQTMPGPRKTSIVLTPRGVELDVLLIPGHLDDYDHGSQSNGMVSRRLNRFTAILGCIVNDQDLPRVGIFVHKVAENEYQRENPSAIALLSPKTESGVLRLTQGMGRIVQHEPVLFAFVVGTAEAVSHRILHTDLVTSTSLPRLSSPKPLVLHVQPHPSFSMVSSYPAARDTKASEVLDASDDSILKIETLNRGLQNKPMVLDASQNLNSVIGGPPVCGILRFFSQETKGDFFVLWGKSESSAGTPFSAGMDSTLCCAIVDWSHIDGFQSQSANTTAPAEVQNPGATEKELLFRLLETNTKMRRSNLPPMRRNSESDFYKVRAYFGHVEFLGRSDAHLFVESLAFARSHPVIGSKTVEGTAKPNPSIYRAGSADQSRWLDWLE